MTFKELLAEKHITAYKLGLACNIPVSKAYDLVNGTQSLTTIYVSKAKRISKVLGFKTIDDMYECLGIDLSIYEL